MRWATQLLSVLHRESWVPRSSLSWFLGECYTEKAESPSNTQESKQRSTQQRTTTRRSANLMKSNQTAARYTLVKDTIIPGCCWT